ncbi:MAG: putative 7-carboxy-7-deazaguanine synthase QueE [Lachnospiraceae bacterium]|nr:putative 7-carboxy-7-deazaguanine synthase QueE [Lachnospiraceae bacterium]
MKYRVVEIFESINGESSRAGELAVFVRFAGCNLRCSYCDTLWALEKDVECELLSTEEILERILKSKIRCVTLTGGEPLLQPGIKELIELLSSYPEISVEIETNGSVSIAEYDEMENRPIMTLDYKLPSSGVESAMLFENYEHLRPTDVIKFVCSDKADLERAEEVIREYKLTEKCLVYFSPVYGDIEPETIVEYMKEKNLNRVRLQLQLHKFIWPPEMRGV